MSRFPNWPPDAGRFSHGAQSRVAVLSCAGQRGYGVADLWGPTPIEQMPGSADYVVDGFARATPPRTFRTIQAAVDQAVRDGDRPRSGG